MPKFSLSGLIAGAGQGAADVGRTLVASGAQLSLEQQRDAAQALRDERIQAFTAKESALTREATAKQHGLDRAMKERQHGETLATAERSTAASLLKNATDALKMAKTDYATDPSNPQFITALKSAESDYRDALSTAKSRLSAAGGAGKAETPKPASGTGEKRDWKAFAPGAKASVSTEPATPAPAPKPGLINQAGRSQADAARLAEIEKMLGKPGAQFNIPLRLERQALREKLGMGYETEE